MTLMLIHVFSNRVIVANILDPASSGRGYFYIGRNGPCRDGRYTHVQSIDLQSGEDDIRDWIG